MKQVLTALFLLTLALSLSANAQWQFVKYFPDTTFQGNLGCHGVATDPDGKVWLMRYGASYTFPGGEGVARQIFVYNADGTPASFNGFYTFNLGGVPETLWNSNRGMRADENGNILFAEYDALYRVDYKTGAAMAKGIPDLDNTTITPGVDAIGEIFSGRVIPKGPIVVSASDITYLGNVCDSAEGYSRCLDVSSDGNDVYWCGYTTGYGAVRLHSDNGSIGPYVAAETLGVGMNTESIGFQPVTGYLWISSGNNYTPAVGWTNFTWYAFDLTTKKVVDSLTWDNSDGRNSDPRPRGIAWSPGGDTAYVGAFNAEGGCVQMFKKGPVSVQPIANTVPDKYALSQNYPNPFNPSTEIQFSIPQGGLTTVKVYDVLGKEVATIVNDNLAPGTYKTRLDGTRLASGTYIYTLTSGNTRISKKMMLMK